MRRELFGELGDEVGPERAQGRARTPTDPAMSRELDPSPTSTDLADNRPTCGATTGARSPQPYFDRLAAAVERLNAARSLSRQLQALAEEAPTITNDSSPTSCSRWPTGRGRCRDAHCHRPPPPGSGHPAQRHGHGRHHHADAAARWAKLGLAVRRTAVSGLLLLSVLAGVLAIINARVPRAQRTSALLISALLISIDHPTREHRTPRVSLASPS